MDREMARRRSSAVGRRFPELCAAYPLALLGLELHAALIASIELGHWPVPSLDDPKGVALLTVWYPALMIAIVFWPAPLIYGVVWTGLDAVLGPARTWVTCARLVALVAANVLLIVVWRHDPWRIGDWLMD